MFGALNSGSTMVTTRRLGTVWADVMAVPVPRHLCAASRKKVPSHMLRHNQPNVYGYADWRKNPDPAGLLKSKLYGSHGIEGKVSRAVQQGLGMVHSFYSCLGHPTGTPSPDEDHDASKSTGMRRVEGVRQDILFSATFQYRVEILATSLPPLPGDMSRSSRLSRFPQSPARYLPVCGPIVRSNAVGPE